MLVPSESLVTLEQGPAERLLAFELLDEAWPRGRTAIERAEIGRQRDDALSVVVAFSSERPETPRRAATLSRVSP